jgi:tetratricopeptide (TPR) repeat protein
MNRREIPRRAYGPVSALPQKAESGLRARFGGTNLAHAPTRFVGRRRELSELRTLLTEGSFVTVVGPPGIGKTRLACELGLALLDEYVHAGGAWRVDLAEARDVDAAIAGIAKTLALPSSAALSARGSTLVVLDAPEACAAPLAKAVARWSREAPLVKWVAASRSRMGVEGELVLELGPLPTRPGPGAAGGIPDAVWLFVDRARGASAEANAVLDDRTAREVHELVRRLEGMPLAIELAAARTDLLTPAQLAVQAGACLDIPGPHAKDARHAALREAMAQTWSTLVPWQQRALSQLGVFAGAFDAQAAAFVLDEEAGRSAADVVASLHERAVLTACARPDEPWQVRHALHASLRDYVRERWGDAERDAIERHARYYVECGLEFAERHDASGDPEAFAGIAAEMEELLVAHRRMLGRDASGAELALGAALSLAPLLASVGAHPLRLQLLDDALRAAERESADPDLRARALESRADARIALAEQEAAGEDLAKAVTAVAPLERPAANARVLRALGALAASQGKTVEARERLGQACRIARDAAHGREHGRALAEFARVEVLEGAADEARATIDAALELHVAAGDRRFEATSYAFKAAMAHAAGDLHEARASAQRALAASRDLGDRRTEADALARMAVLAHEADPPETALDLYARALAAHHEIGALRAEARLLGRQAALLLSTGDDEGARAVYTRALAVMREHDDDLPGQALVLAGLGALEARAGSVDLARGALARATACLEGIDDRPVRAALHLWRGHVETALARRALADGDAEHARRLADAAAKRLDEATARGGDPNGGSDLRVAAVALRQSIAALAGDGARVQGPASTDGPPPDAPADALVVCARGRWFRAPGGDVVSVARWRPLQRLLERLAQRREIAPGEPLTVDALVAAGWPGERMLAKAGATRVYTAIASLRRLGLREVLAREDGGYVLRADVRIVRI